MPEWKPGERAWYWQGARVVHVEIRSVSPQWASVQLWGGGPITIRTIHKDRLKTYEELPEGLRAGVPR